MYTIPINYTDRIVLSFLKISHKIAAEGNFILGAKLVRGAYMEKERARAEAMGYPSPIQIDKSASDADFDSAVVFCLDHLDQIGLILASHNEASNLKCAQMMQDKGVPNNHPHIHFSQLYGMSDHISFNMALEGYKVSKYLPFGPVARRCSISHAQGTGKFKRERPNQ